MIIENRTNSIKAFRDIEDGQIFTDTNGVYYIKISPSYESVSGDFDNAVKLTNGLPVYFDKTTGVYHVENCKLIIY